MADATTLPTASPKQLGKQLRAVRRRKGLSLSEVARGAGLSRRELVNYERGKVEIPESDLWVLAGSCGVDVAELVPPAEPLALNAAPASIEDTITQLRSTQPDAGLSRHLDTLYALRALPAGSGVQLQDREREAMAEALGNDPATIESKLIETMHLSKDEARRLRALIVPDAPRYTPLAIEAPEPEPAPPPAADEEFFAAAAPGAPFASVAAGSTSAFDADVPTGPVDVFEELAKLPEPVALPDPGDDHTDLLAPQPEPAAFANGAGHDLRHDAFAAWPAFRSALPEPTVEPITPPTGEPILVDMQTATTATEATTYGAEHAPPIDVVGRTGEFDAYASDASADTLPTREPSTWESAPPIWDTTWTPNGATGGSAGPTDIVEFVDDYVIEPTGPGASAGITDAETSPLWSTWNRAEFVDEAVEIDEVVNDATSAPHSVTGPWDHEPDPAATSSGFYVDWGTDPLDETTPAAAIETGTTFESTTTFDPETDEPAAYDPATYEPATYEPATDEPATDEPGPSPWEVADADDTTPAGTDVWEPTGSWNGSTAWDTTSVADVDTDAPTWDETTPDTDPPTWEEVTPDDAPAWEEATPDDEPAVISWRPLAETVLAAVAVELATVSPDGLVDDTTAEPGPIEPEVTEPEVVEEFVIAGPEWDLGNAVPLVEVRGHGGLVMRRADERWALADVTTTPNFALEVDVDFRSGPGFGVLFRASTDADGHMSGYSFDVDPIHEGGSYLVRQWHADRELWNPIARVAAPDPAGMHGLLTLRLVVSGDQLVAHVNGAAVLSVDSLDAACAERNREAATGDRVGIQAWSSSDLVIETLRVAPR